MVQKRDIESQIAVEAEKESCTLCGSSTDLFTGSTPTGRGIKLCDCDPKINSTTLYICPGNSSASERILLHVTS